VASNQSHGLKRTNDDKRLAVKLALQAAPDWSNGRIAEHVGVDDKTVAAVRDTLTSGPEFPDLKKPAKRVGKDGNWASWSGRRSFE
jgi:hypothetical protein